MQSAMPATEIPAKIRLKVLRQKDQDSPSYWEEYEIQNRDKLNVISALMDVQKNPTTVEGKAVHPRLSKTLERITATISRSGSNR
jgi:hypothetical protein